MFLSVTAAELEMFFLLGGGGILACYVFLMLEMGKGKVINSLKFCCLSKLTEYGNAKYSLDVMTGY